MTIHEIYDSGKIGYISEPGRTATFNKIHPTVRDQRRADDIAGINVTAKLPRGKGDKLSTQRLEAICPKLVSVRETIDSLVGQLEAEISNLDEQRKERITQTDEMLQVAANSKIPDQKNRIDQLDTATTEKVTSQAGDLKKLVEQLKSLKNKIVQTIESNYSEDHTHVKLIVTEDELYVIKAVIADCKRLGFDPTLAERLKQLMENHIQKVVDIRATLSGGGVPIVKI